MKDAKFLKDKHRPSCFVPPAHNTNSLIYGGDYRANQVSAHMYPPGGATAIAQPNGRTGLLAYVPGIPAGIVPSGGSAPTGFSNYFFIANAYEQHPSIKAYPEETIREKILSSAWMPTGR